MVDKREIKKEAIKWVKETKITLGETGKTIDMRDLIISSWIKHFFNITSEDLK